MNMGQMLSGAANKEIGFIPLATGLAGMTLGVDKVLQRRYEKKGKPDAKVRAETEAGIQGTLALGSAALMFHHPKVRGMFPEMISMEHGKPMIKIKHALQLVTVGT